MSNKVTLQASKGAQFEQPANIFLEHEKATINKFRQPTLIVTNK